MGKNQGPGSGINIPDPQHWRKVEEKAVKMVSGLKGNTFEEKCAELGLETLKSSKELQDIALVHKYVEGDMQDLFTRPSNNRGVRNRREPGEQCLVKQFAGTNIRKNSFAVRI
jgi:hypothetical protein